MTMEVVSVARALVSGLLLNIFLLFCSLFFLCCIARESRAARDVLQKSYNMNEAAAESSVSQSQGRHSYTVTVATRKDRLSKKEAEEVENVTPKKTKTITIDDDAVQPLEQDSASVILPSKTLPEDAMVISYRGSMQIPSPVARDSALKVTLEKLYYCKYLVRSGDRIKDIAYGFHASLSSFAEALGLDVDAPIAPGTELYVPVKHYVVGSKAETINDVARKHSLAASELLAVNKVAGDRFAPGKVVILPILYANSTTGIVAMTTKHKSTVATDFTRPTVVKQNKAKAGSPAGQGISVSAAIDSKKPREVISNAAKATAGQKFIWPVKTINNKTVIKNSSDGVRIAVPSGMKISAIGDGVVGYVGSDVDSYGNLIIIKHDDNFISVYGHTSKTMVQVGDKVKMGQVIALTGATGKIDMPHLFFSLRRNKQVLNPRSYLRY